MSTQSSFVRSGHRAARNLIGFALLGGHLAFLAVGLYTVASRTTDFLQAAWALTHELPPSTSVPRNAPSAGKAASGNAGVGSAELAGVSFGAEPPQSLR
jgi:hypothetical protein